MASGGGGGGLVGRSGTTQGSSSTHGRPTALLQSVPKIFLDTTSRNKICLLPPDRCAHSGHSGSRCGGGSGGAGDQANGPVCSAAIGSCSLPNLACDPDLVLARPMCAADLEQPPEAEGDTSRGVRVKSSLGPGGLQHQPRRASGPAGVMMSASKLSVYCSPRISRRGLVIDPSVTGTGDAAALGVCYGGQTQQGCGHHEHQHPRVGEFSWLHNADLVRFLKNEMNRRESNSSVESDSSLRSASHMSTCATSEYTRFASCDRLSLPVHDLSPSLPTAPLTGRLRRIYSNPEAPFLKEASASSEMRDSKSCSDLKDQQQSNRSLVDHSDLERKLSTDATRYLLSPPALLPSCTAATTSGVDEDVADGACAGGAVAASFSAPRLASLSSGHFLPVLGSPPPLDGWEERVTGSGTGSRHHHHGDGTKVSRDHMIREWLQGVDPAIVVSSSDFPMGTGNTSTTAAAGAVATS